MVEQVKAEIEQFLLEDLVNNKVEEIGIDILSKFKAGNNTTFKWSENLIVDRFYSEFDQQQIDLLFTQTILVILLSTEECALVMATSEFSVLITLSFTIMKKMIINNQGVNFKKSQVTS